MTTSEGTLVEEHVHYWIIDSSNVGHCSCEEVRDFGKLLRREGHLLGSKSKSGGTKGKRGKGPATRANMSASAKKHWQDPEYRAKQSAAHASLPGRHHKKEALV